MSQKKHVDAPVKCPYFEHCNFVHNNMDAMPNLIVRTLQNYCTQKECSCARKTVYDAIGIDAVPELMLPDQHSWAVQFIEEYDPEQDSVDTPVAEGSHCG